MLKKVKNLIVQEEGQALTEYALIVGLIAAALVTTLVSLKTDIKAVFDSIITAL